MDVSEFLRLNAKESSLQSERQMLLQRSSGDGEDSPVCSPRDPAGPVLPTRPQAAPLAGAQLPALVPPSGELAGIKTLMPYKIEVNAKTSHSSTKKKRCKTPQSKAYANLDIINESVNLINAKNSYKVTDTSNNDIQENTRSNSPVMDKVNILVKTLSKEAVIAPLDSELLNSPPKEIENKEKISITLRPAGVPLTKHSSVKYTQLTRKVYKEPKFVPYEPYKGCANPMFGNKSTKKTIKKEFALTSQPSLPIVTGTPGVHKDHDKKARAKLEMVVKDFEAERVTWDERLKEMTEQCGKLEQDLAKNKREKITLEDQLNVQAKVNSELKKLLVASVGEDVQGRMHCLTEDKARMANMIRRYSEKLDRDFEERERMSIQCDVWKSKFLASSVLVEELGSWKASLLRWTSEAAEALSVLLDELQFVRTHARRAYMLVQQLVTAFDPLNGSSGVSVGGDGVSVSLAVADQVQALHQRLLGPLMPPPLTEGGLNDDTHSPGEKMAVQVLDRQASCIGYPGYAGGAGGVRVPRGHPLNSATSTLPSHATMNCCAHCNGEIQLV